MIITAEIFITLRPKNIYFPDNDEVKPEPYKYVNNHNKKYLKN